jgi:hypothetical protein
MGPRSGNWGENPHLRKTAQWSVNGDDGNLFLGLVSCQFMNWKSVIAGLKGVSGFFGVSIRRIIPSKRVAILNRLLLHRIPFWQLQRKSNPKVIFVALGM